MTKMMDPEDTTEDSYQPHNIKEEDEGEERKHEYDLTQNVEPANPEDRNARGRSDTKLSHEFRNAEATDQEDKGAMGGSETSARTETLGACGGPSADLEHHTESTICTEKTLPKPAGLKKNRDEKGVQHLMNVYEKEKSRILTNTKSNVAEDTEIKDEAVGLPLEASDEEADDFQNIRTSEPGGASGGDLTPSELQYKKKKDDRMTPKTNVGATQVSALKSPPKTTNSTSVIDNVEIYHEDPTKATPSGGKEPKPHPTKEPKTGQTLTFGEQGANHSNDTGIDETMGQSKELRPLKKTLQNSPAKPRNQAQELQPLDPVATDQQGNTDQDVRDKGRPDLAEKKPTEIEETQTSGICKKKALDHAKEDASIEKGEQNKAPATKKKAQEPPQLLVTVSAEPQRNNYQGERDKRRHNLEKYRNTDVQQAQTSASSSLCRKKALDHANVDPTIEEDTKKPAPATTKRSQRPQLKNGNRGATATIKGKGMELKSSKGMSMGQGQDYPLVTLQEAFLCFLMTASTILDVQLLNPLFGIQLWMFFIVPLWALFLHGESRIIQINFHRNDTVNLRLARSRNRRGLWVYQTLESAYSNLVDCALPFDVYEFGTRKTYDLRNMAIQTEGVEINLHDRPPVYSTGDMTLTERQLYLLGTREFDRFLARYPGRFMLIPGCVIVVIKTEKKQMLLTDYRNGTLQKHFRETFDDLADNMDIEMDLDTEMATTSDYCVIIIRDKDQKN